MASTTTKGRDPGERLLDAAAELFDREGIRAVGVDRLISDAGVARASLYQHFGSKESLVLAYLRRVDAADRARFASTTARLAGRPRDRIAAVFSLAEASARRRRFRGLPVRQRADRVPERGHGVQAVVTAHREWLLDELTSALREAGVAEAGDLAATIQLLYDGALVGSKARRDVDPIRRAAALADRLVELAL